MSVVFALHGVHGSGKTHVSRIMAEDLGLKYILSDAADHFPEVLSFDPLLRQHVYTHLSLLNYSRALGIASNGDAVVLDFGPLQAIPYIRWFLGERGKHIEEILRRNVDILNGEGNAGVVNVFFVIRKDPDIVIERIARRARKGFLNEELDKNYLEFIDNGMKELAEELRENGETVEFIEADATFLEKALRFKEIVEKHVK